MTGRTGLRITAVLLFLCIGLVLLELGVRMFRMELAPLVAANNWPCIFQPDADTGYSYVPNARGRFVRNFEIDREIVINSDGYHDFELSSDPGAVKVVAVGDSFTAGFQVDLGEVWPNVAEAELRRLTGDAEIEVVNLGLDGTGTDVQLARLTVALTRYQPEVVILAFNPTDFADVTRPRLYRGCKNETVLVYQSPEQRLLLEDYVVKNAPGSAMRWLFENVYLFRIALKPVDSAHFLRLNSAPYSLLDSTVAESPAAEPDRGADYYFQQLITLAEQRGFTLLTMPMPMREGVHASITALEKNASASLIARLNMIDMPDELERMLAVDGVKYDDLYWRYDDHLNSIGYEYMGRIAAARIAEELQPRGTMPE